MKLTTVLIQNSYACGRTSKSRVLVDPRPAGLSLDDWFNYQVFPHTGDGHQHGGTEENAMHEVVVLDGYDHGARYSWEG